MSYSILYRSMFVKLSDGRFVPMMEMGDNNVWDCSCGGRGRRSRGWSNFNLNCGQKFFTKDEIEKSLEKWFNESEQKRDRDSKSDLDWARESAEKASFGYYEAIAVYGKGGTSGTTFKDVRNIVLSGVKNCISVEEAIKKCGFRITYWEKNDNDIALTCQKYERFGTEEEMLSFIKKKFGDDYSKFYFIFNENYETNRCYNMCKAIKGFARVDKVSEGFFIKCKKRDEDKDFYLKLSESGFSLVEDISEATRFYKYKSGVLSLTDIVFGEFKEISNLNVVK